MKIVTIHCYVDQLIDNTDGKFDKFGSAWFSVPVEWAEAKAKENGFNNLDHFYNEYTYDHTDGWLSDAVEEGILEGCGTGKLL